MSEQIFISYRRDGGDVTAKLICEALKNHGYTVFYDFDSLHGGYFDDRIYKAIEGCNDFVLVLPPNSLDRCVNADDWVRLEIKHALDYGKNIIPVMLPGFSFPKKLPDDIAIISRINGIPFIMAYFDRAVIPEIIDRLRTSAISFSQPMTEPEPETEPCSNANGGLEFTLNKDGSGYIVSKGTCTDKEIVIPKFYNGIEVTEMAMEAFSDLYGLKSISIPNSVKSIPCQAFSGCISLTSITIPDSVTCIEAEAFYCSSLTSIIIPDSVTCIEAGAFCNCSKLTSITLPKSITEIGQLAFGLEEPIKTGSDYKTVKYNGTVRQWQNIKLGKNCFPRFTVIHCTDGDYSI